MSHELRDRGCFKEGTDRELNSKCGAGSADEPRGKQGMTAEREEIVVDSDMLFIQHRREQVAEAFLRWRARSLTDLYLTVWTRQCSAVQLAVWSQWPLRQDENGGRSHVLRQRLPHVFTQDARQLCVGRTQRRGVGISAEIDCPQFRILGFTPERIENDLRSPRPPEGRCTQALRYLNYGCGIFSNCIRARCGQIVYMPCACLFV